MDSKENKSVEPAAEAAPKVNLMDKEPSVAAVENSPEPTAGAAVKNRSNIYTIVTTVLVIVALLAVLFQLERQGRIGTNLFGSMIAALEADTSVATVNGEDIKVSDLEEAIEQLSQAAAQQGFDITDAGVSGEIRNQAVEMMVNIKLLEQSAIVNNIVVEQEAIDARITELAEAAGGREELLARLAEFEIDEVQLRLDVEEELTIRALFDQVFSDEQSEVTQEEIVEMYDNAVAGSNGQPLPPLEEVSDQISQQIQQTKEQAAIEEYVQQLRTDADIVIN